MTGEARQATEFVNRVRELAILEQMLLPEKMPGLLFLCGPSGLGKSRLTDELAARNAGGNIGFARVDPGLRPNAGPSSVYEGFFLQQCAGALDALARTTGIEGLDSLEAFLKERRWTAVREKKLGDAIRQFPSWETLYGVAFEYVERLFVFGQFGREQLLSSDSREAVATCQAYVDAMVGRARMVLIVRQAELIDHLSLRALLAFNRSASANLLIFEYAASGFGFGPDHDKLVQAEIALHPNGHIFQLTKLEPHHLELFLRQLELPSQVVEWSTSAQWDGNLRQLTRFQHVFTVHTHMIAGTPPLQLLGPADLDALVTDQVSTLQAAERALLALVAAEAQPIERLILLQVAHRMLPSETLARLTAAIGFLVNDARLLRNADEIIALADPELLPAIERATGYGAAKVLAETALRDFYVEAIRAESAMLGSATAMRRALTFAARTGDQQMLLTLLEACDGRIASVNDQGLYVDLVASSIEANAELLPSEQARLVQWAATLAYDICDFRKCRSLLEQRSASDPVDIILLASCMIEDGDHTSARGALASLDRTASLSLMLAMDVLDGTIALDAGVWDIAKVILGRVARDAADEAPGIAGHALRLLAELLPFPQCTITALESVAMFDAAGLRRAAAFSAMSASRFLAREGRIAEARTMLERTETLRGSVRDDHMIRNNRALIELLSPTPDYAAAAAELQLALRSSRDDFSDVTILCNLAISLAGAGELANALDCVARGAAILEAPGFAERDIFWAVCFNFSWVMTLAGRAEEAVAMRARPSQAGWGQRSNDVYWAWRYDEAPREEDAELGYLRSFPYHPVALSHWQLDREVVATLTGRSRQ